MYSKDHRSQYCLYLIEFQGVPKERVPTFEDWLRNKEEARAKLNSYLGFRQELKHHFWR